MDIIKLLFFFLSLLSPRLSAQTDCPNTKCPNSNFPIHFPFQLNNHQSLTCSYPGFNLRCTNQQKTAIYLPYSGEFLVRSINYRAQTIDVYDPFNCLSRRLLDLNLTGTPFEVALYKNFTFIVCPSEIVQSLTVIDCLSNSTNSTLTTTSVNIARSMTYACQEIFTARIPVSFPGQYEEAFFADLGEDLVLKWSVPDCEECEANGGTCGYKNGRMRGLSIFKIIALSIALPAITCSFCLAILMCYIDTRRRRNNNILNGGGATVTPDTMTMSTLGLDGPTIESYTQVILGESKRLPGGPNGNTCPICLSEYNAKETVRCIPECQHCFHSNCVDEWLRLKGTCPVCRNSPSPAC
ncbi:hypothetical protein LguiB_023767 [Lonicera macranthoides]